MSLTTPPPATRPTRREFATALALTALGACVGRPVGRPSAEARVAPALATPAPPPTGPAPETATKPPDPATEALVAAIAARYGADVVPAAERGAFRDAVGRTVELSRRLRQPPVANAVDPFSSLYPAPAPSRAPAARRRRGP